MTTRGQRQLRTATVERKTAESEISITLNLDGQGTADVSTGNGMLDHMLGQIARHGVIDLKVKASGDGSMGWHHVEEDTAIVLGRCLDKALGDRRGIVRMSHAIVPLDEALAMVAVDLGGRGYAVVDTGAPEYGGEMAADMVRHFLESFAVEAKANLHVRILTGKSDHHRTEAIFKALARALRAAVAFDDRAPGAVPSTKGVIG
ncbi:MAG: imidazoleglycerol-phosphate dehydratase HisB [Chloroflexi bacterium]|nr:imidazoleglycerol-phosphate dehydratase HisB [Chloroflexota bacterium]